jgi:hypothetical protein
MNVMNLYHEITCWRYYGSNRFNYW